MSLTRIDVYNTLKARYDQSTWLTLPGLLAEYRSKVAAVEEGGFAYYDNLSQFEQWAYDIAVEYRGGINQFRHPGDKTWPLHVDADPLLVSKGDALQSDTFDSVANPRQGEAASATFGPYKKSKPLTVTTPRLRGSQSNNVGPQQHHDNISKALVPIYERPTRKPIPRPLGRQRKKQKIQVDGQTPVSIPRDDVTREVGVTGLAQYDTDFEIVKKPYHKRNKPTLQPPVEEGLLPLQEETKYEVSGRRELTDTTTTTTAESTLGPSTTLLTNPEAAIDASSAEFQGIDGVRHDPEDLFGPTNAESDVFLQKWDQYQSLLRYNAILKASEGDLPRIHESHYQALTSQTHKNAVNNTDLWLHTAQLITLVIYSEARAELHGWPKNLIECIYDVMGSLLTLIFPNDTIELAQEVFTDPAVIEGLLVELETKGLWSDWASFFGVNSNKSPFVFFITYYRHHFRQILLLAQLRFNPIFGDLQHTIYLGKQRKTSKTPGLTHEAYLERAMILRLAIYRERDGDIGRFQFTETQEIHIDGLDDILKPNTQGGAFTMHFWAQLMIMGNQMGKFKDVSYQPATEESRRRRFALYEDIYDENGNRIQRTGWANQPWNTKKFISTATNYVGAALYLVAVGAAALAPGMADGRSRLFITSFIIPLVHPAQGLYASYVQPAVAVLAITSIYKTQVVAHAVLDTIGENAERVGENIVNFLPAVALGATVLIAIGAGVKYGLVSGVEAGQNPLRAAAKELTKKRRKRKS
jgi:hypothetical protein